MAFAPTFNLTFKTSTRILFGFGHPKPYAPKSSIAKPSTTKSDKIFVLPEFGFEEYRTSKVKQVNEALEKAIQLQNFGKLHEAMRYTLLGRGKRIFPLVCIASGELIGGFDIKKALIMPTSCALEIAVTLFLIIDDLPCFDNDEYRQGKPSSHKVFGEATTILASQALGYFLIEHILSKTKGVSPDLLVRVIIEICSALGSQGVALGQWADMDGMGKEVKLSDIEFINSHKTAKLMEAAAVCGGLLGGANEVEVERLRKYGHHIGLAFQVRNDILDVVGSFEKFGKKTGRDLERDNPTLLKLMGLEESEKYAKKLVAQAFEDLAYFDSTRVAPLYHIANFAITYEV